MLWDPSKGELKNEADRPIVIHIVRYLAKICEDYVNSSSTTWDLTMDVQNRPQWLKDVEKQQKEKRSGIYAKRRSLPTFRWKKAPKEISEADMHAMGTDLEAEVEESWL